MQPSGPPQPSPPPNPGTPRPGVRRPSPALLSGAALTVAVVALAIAIALPALAPPGYSVSTTLQHGQDESGLYSAFGSGMGLYFATVVDYRLPLAANLLAADATFIVVGMGFTPACPGLGQAGAGQLCVYQTGNYSEDFIGFFDPADPFGPNSSALGFEMLFNVTFSTYGYSEGTWTVGAP
jgi:hypothetical protein